MAIFWAMFPFYIIGNLHCFGMCGPVAMLLAEHPYRALYFIGRVLSFTLAGLIAGAMGEVLHVYLSQYHLQESISLLFGSIIALLSIGAIFKWHLPLPFINLLKNRMAQLSMLVHQNNPWASFLMGFFTVLLPCGQSLIVFSACATTLDTVWGALNAFAFAILTSPSLFLAMKAVYILQLFKPYYNQIMGTMGLIVGILLILRGLAQLDYIPHLILNPSYPTPYHIILYWVTCT